MRRAAAILPLALALACGGVRPEGAAEGRVSPPTAGGIASPHDPSPPPGAATGPVVGGRVDLRAATMIGEAAGKRWVVALPAGDERRGALLLHLDRGGRLAETALPWWSEDVAIERGEPPRLRVIDTEARRWFAVDLADPDAPTIGEVRPIPGLVAGAYPKGVASDGVRALVSLYREAPRGASQRYLGETFLLDVASGRRVGAPGPATVWAATCAGGRCYGLAEANRDPQPSVIVTMDDAGYRELGELGPWRCPGAETWEVGDTWFLAWADRGRVGLVAVDLPSGAIRRGAIELDGDACPFVQAVEVAGGRALVIDVVGEPRLVEVDGALRGGPPQPLPAMSFERQAYARVDAWLLAIDYRAASGMIHDPPGPDGSYEYREVWDFSGRGGLLEASGGRWRWRREAALPHSGESGDFGDGYRPLLMTAPGRGGVLLVGDGLPSEFVALIGPGVDAPPG
ncbi:MAG: hypothetical protein H6710_07675 [Myxococcales bacterium]|nr:hypothetical protein [Myxococcales bacterium]